jgi:hypothetical protein
MLRPNQRDIVKVRGYVDLVLAVSDIRVCF